MGILNSDTEQAAINFQFMGKKNQTKNRSEKTAVNELKTKDI